MVSFTRVVSPLVLFLLWLGPKVKSAAETVDLTPYLLDRQNQEDVPHSFQLGFVGKVSHQLLFRYGAEEAVELEIALAYPAGGATRGRWGPSKDPP